MNPIVKGIGGYFLAQYMDSALPRFSHALTEELTLGITKGLSRRITQNSVWQDLICTAMNMTISSIALAAITFYGASIHNKLRESPFSQGIAFHFLEQAIILFFDRPLIGSFLKQDCLYPFFFNDNKSQIRIYLSSDSDKANLIFYRLAHGLIASVSAFSLWYFANLNPITAVTIANTISATILITKQRVDRMHEKAPEESAS